MDLRGFLPELRTWSLSKITCAAGLLALSAGVSYCVYRRLQTERAPLVHTQPPHEPEVVDVLEEAADVPPVLQPVEPSLQLMPAEPYLDAPAVILDVTGVQPAAGPLLQFLVSLPNQDSTDDELFRAQVAEPDLEPLHTDLQEEPEAVDPPLEAGELSNAWDNVQFLSKFSSISTTGSLLIKTYFLGMMRGPQSRLCWFKTKESCYVDHEWGTYHSCTEDWFTAIQTVSGRVTEYISCNRVETTDITPHEEVQIVKKVTCSYLYVDPDDQVDASTWTQENTPDTDEESEPDSEESFNPEQLEVPFMCDHLQERGITDIGPKLCALRQAFSTLLASIHNQNFLFVAAKKIVMRLAAANNQNAVGVKRAYEDLIRYLRKPANYYYIEAELSGAEFHFNFLDVVFELLLFQIFRNGVGPQPYTGGFLERLFSLTCMWDVDVWTPAARIYFTELVNQLTALCEALFSQPVELYSDPAALASAVLRLLWNHVPVLEKL